MKDVLMRTMVMAASVALWAVGQAGPLSARDRMAPAVSLHTSDGQRVRLSDFKGKVVLVDLWASWCTPCQASFPAIDAIFIEYRTRGLEVVAINLDAHRSDADRFLAARPHEMLVVFDSAARTLDAFAAPGVPSSYVIDRHGRIRFSHAGYSSSTPIEYRQEIEKLLAEPAP